MKLLDVVSQLRRRLPAFTDAFTDTIPVASAVHVGTTATLMTDDDHGLAVGDWVHVMGAVTPVPVQSMVRVGDVATLVTSVDHDLTLYPPDAADLNVAVLSGANEPGFVGTFELLGVANRREFTVRVDTSAPSAATGDIVVENGSNALRTVAGLHAVASVPSPTQVTVQHTAAQNLGTLTGDITLRARPRITGAVEEEAAFDSFTPPAPDPSGARPVRAWLYAVLGDARTSRGTSSTVDAHDTQTVGTSWQQQLLQPLQVLVVVSAANQSLGRNARDQMQDLLQPILRSLVGWRHPNELASGACPELQFVGHALSRYDRSVYWHEFIFEGRELVSFEDTVGTGVDVAFRDVEIHIEPGEDGTDVPISVNTSLDEEVL